MHGISLAHAASARGVGDRGRPVLGARPRERGQRQWRRPRGSRLSVGQAVFDPADPGPARRRRTGRCPSHGRRHVGTTLRRWHQAIPCSGVCGARCLCGQGAIRGRLRQGPQAKRQAGACAGAANGLSGRSSSHGAGRDRRRQRGLGDAGSFRGRGRRPLARRGGRVRRSSLSAPTILIPRPHSTARPSCPAIRPRRSS